MNKIKTLSLLTFSILLLVVFLYWQGRPFICECGTISLWSGNIWSSENSQQFSDPYSFTHLQHGLVFFILIAILLPKLKANTKFLIAIFVEVLWEIVENSTYVINIYRTNTASLGYTGDSILNSIGDILFCVIGYLIAKRLGIKKAIILFLFIEVTMVYLLRDSLILNIITMIHPFESIVNWQLEAAIAI